MYLIVLNVMKEGGWIMWPIITASFVVWWLGLWKLYTLWRLRRARKLFLRDWDKKDDWRGRTTGNPHYDRLIQLRRDGSISGGTFKAFFREFLLVTVSGMNSGLSTIAVWISVAPLLGLLGTVAGMIRTFKVITLFGAGNPALTAEGISVALITTEAGLTVAFPGLLLHTFLTNRKNSLQQKIARDGEILCRSIDGPGKVGVSSM